MDVRYLHEPELEFGAGQHVDIRFGLRNYGPLDFDNPLAPRRIKVAVVGTNETIEGVGQWLERCRRSITPKESRQPHLFPGFPGCNPDAGLRTELVLDDRLQRSIPTRAFDALKRHKSANGAIAEAVDLFFAEMEHLVQQSPPDVLLCALPSAQLEIVEQLERVPRGRMATNGAGSADGAGGDGRIESRLDFRDMLKAKAMTLGRPIQLILPATYDPTKRRSQKIHPDQVRQTQDEATRAWNFHTALYYKAGGTPWRIVREATAYTTCYVGVSFYRSLDREHLHTSVAQVFDERGDGIIVRGGPARIAKEDRQPHLEAAEAERLLADALTRYRAEHKTLPARVVLHKSSRFDDGEIEGFTAAAGDKGIEMIDLLSLGNAETRLFRSGSYPPLRGTLLTLNPKTYVLYTRGSVDFFATYPGMYVPRPMLMRCASTEQTPAFLAREILALSKMNWNNTQFDGADPITLAAARKVSEVLRYTDEGQAIAPRYSFYM